MNRILRLLIIFGVTVLGAEEVIQTSKTTKWEDTKFTEKIVRSEIFSEKNCFSSKSSFIPCFYALSVISFNTHDTLLFPKGTVKSLGKYYKKTSNELTDAFKFDRERFYQDNPSRKLFFKPFKKLFRVLNDISNSPYIIFRIKLDQIIDDLFESIPRDKKLQTLANGFASYISIQKYDHADFGLFSSFEKLDFSTSEESGYGIVFVQNDNGMRLIEIFEGSGADKANLQDNDIITHIDGKDVTKVRFKLLKDLIKDKEKVSIDFLRNNEKKTTILEKTKYTYKNERAKIFDQTLVIKIDSFYSTLTCKNVESLIDKHYEKINSLIFDLRGNTGGRVQMATCIADLLTAPGLPLSIGVDINTQHQEVVYSSKEKKYDLNVTILSNHQSASASEVLIQALVDNDPNTILVGERTYGKGTIQIIKEHPLDPENLYFKITIGKLLGPKKKGHQLTGIIPHFIINDPRNDLHELREIDSAIRPVPGENKPIKYIPNKRQLDCSKTSDHLKSRTIESYNIDHQLYFSLDLLKCLTRK